MNFPLFQSTKELQYSYAEKSSLWNMNYQHYHDGYEIYLQIEGERQIFFNGKSYLLQPGTLFIITPHILHATKNIDDNILCSRYILNFSPKIFKGLLNESELNELTEEMRTCIFQLNDEQVNMFIEHMNHICDYWALHLQGKKRGKKLAYMETCRIMDHLIRLIQNIDNIHGVPDVPIVSEPEIYRVLHHIDHHYHEDLNIDEILKISHMSKANFYRIFKKVTGDSFNHYLNCFRAVKAHALITQSKLSLQEIANKTGFSSTAHMTRIFKELHGVSPSEYRRMI